ncbi:Peptidoglycan-N-acetylglucosamine deacetylase [Tolypocladium capitatum]|uniref:Peptidoglycan-N-acetylglucosamine deacetylase n=1 Tax=Tolypocladium capitatum TaxID=45235 RepID=A0A2K3PU88_9HYPO|nr:Peptidoglycan-N-acetylglucosamine deacetylase [Tolypocladium capitatum]
MELGVVRMLAHFALLAFWHAVTLRARAHMLPVGVARAPPECGLGSTLGKCPRGSCCSETGFCGTASEYCEGSQCQLEYSDSCDTFFGPNGLDTSDISRPKIGNVPYGTTITRCTKPGTMALTFDDGPWKYTSQILDLLDELKVTATFFIAGHNKGKGHIDDSSPGYREILKRMSNSGHHIGSHTWTHRDLNRLLHYDDPKNKDLGPRVRKTELIFNEMALRNIFGWIPTYMRAPYLECSSPCQDFLARWGYHVISTNVDTKDYMFDNPSLIEQSKKRFSDGVSESPTENGYIVLAHDVHYQTVANLTAYMVEVARKRGYKLVTVGECLGDPKQNCPQRRPAQRHHRTPNRRGHRGPLRINAAVGARDIRVKAPISGTAAPTTDTGSYSIAPSPLLGSRRSLRRSAAVRARTTAAPAVTPTLGCATPSGKACRIQPMASAGGCLRQRARMTSAGRAARDMATAERGISSADKGVRKSMANALDTRGPGGVEQPAPGGEWYTEVIEATSGDHVLGISGFDVSS